MLYVNGKAASEFDAALKEGYTVTGMEITEASYSHLRNRSTLIYHDTVLGLKSITFSVDFHGADEHELALKKSMLDAEIFGNCELILPDGFQYSCVCSSLGQEDFHGPNLLEVSYQLTGLRHGSRQKVSGKTVFCESTLPKTDCILSVKVGASGKNYKIGTVTFSAVTAGENLCVDGITKRILVNGVPAAQRAEWMEFPYLKPGLKTIVCQDVPTVEFYPAYF